MRAFHDSRNPVYRSPFGALRLGESVTLAIDVWDTPDATVALRTWIDGVGEGLLEMHPANDAGGAKGDALPTVAADAKNTSQPTRFLATLTPDAPGIVWYQFVIRTQESHELRYGAQDGKTGGPGRLESWEPPSFLLAIYDPDAPLPADFRAIEERTFEAETVRYLRGESSAASLLETIATLRESYPSSLQDSVFSMLDTPDCANLLARLGGASADELERMKRDDAWQLDEYHLGLAKGRLWCASLIQILARPLPNTASLAARWEHIDKDCGDIVRNAFELGCSLPPFAADDTLWFAVNDDVLGSWKTNSPNEAACVLINASLVNAHNVPIPFPYEAVSDVLGGYAVPVRTASQASGDSVGNAPVPAPPTTCKNAGSSDAQRFVVPCVYQLGTTVLYFHPSARLQRDMQPGIGVLAHITSLPTDASHTSDKLQHAGTLGEPARHFVDWLAQAGIRYWQVLPVNPTDDFGSPYAGISAFAGNVQLLEGGFKPEPNAFAEIADSADYREFCVRESDWLEPYACFMAIRQNAGAGKAWQDWPEKYRHFDPCLVQNDPELAPYAETWRRAQFVFQQQWSDLRSYANEKGVQIIGDMPIYVSADSVDVWANRNIFQLTPDGVPDKVAGCPPDPFAADGQIWGNPLYNWDALQADGYSWWMRRLQRAFQLYDWVRLDHFIGFSRYFAIPAGAPATEGVYCAGPGLDFFQKACNQFGLLPIIAEDLGSITPAVRALGAACGFPGMDIVQFVDGNDPLSGYYPRPEKIAYTGTHDNQTLVGYCEQRYPHLDALEAAKDLIEAAITSSAAICILPLQDVLLLDDDARMNVPGTAEGNWIWQAEHHVVEQAADILRSISELYGTDI